MNVNSHTDVDGRASEIKPTRTNYWTRDILDSYIRDRSQYRLLPMARVQYSMFALPSVLIMIHMALFEG